MDQSHEEVLGFGEHGSFPRSGVEEEDQIQITAIAELATPHLAHPDHQKRRVGELRGAPRRELGFRAGECLGERYFREVRQRPFHRRPRDGAGEIEEPDVQGMAVDKETECAELLFDVRHISHPQGLCERPVVGAKLLRREQQLCGIVEDGFDEAWVLRQEVREKARRCEQGAQPPDQFGAIHQELVVELAATDTGDKAIEVVEGEVWIRGGGDFSREIGGELFEQDAGGGQRHPLGLVPRKELENGGRVVLRDDARRGFPSHAAVLGEILAKRLGAHFHRGCPIRDPILVGFEAVDLAFFPHLQAVLETAEKAVRRAQRRRVLGRQEIHTLQSLEGAERARIPHLQDAPAVEQLQGLGDELDVPDPARVPFYVEPVAPVTAFLHHLLFEGADALHRRVVHRASVEARRHRLDRPPPEVVVARHRARLGKGGAFPGVGARFVVRGQSALGNRDRSARAFGAQVEVDPVQEALAPALGHLLGQRATEALEVFAGQLSPLVFRAGGDIAVEIDQVDIGGVVELSGTEFSEPEDTKGRGGLPEHGSAEARRVVRGFGAERALEQDHRQLRELPEDHLGFVLGNEFRREVAERDAEQRFVFRVAQHLGRGGLRGERLFQPGAERRGVERRAEVAPHGAFEPLWVLAQSRREIGGVGAKAPDHLLGGGVPRHRVEFQERLGEEMRPLRLRTPGRIGVRPVRHRRCLAHVSFANTRSAISLG